MEWARLLDEIPDLQLRGKAGMIVWWDNSVTGWPDEREFAPDFDRETDIPTEELQKVLISLGYSEKHAAIRAQSPKVWNNGKAMNEKLEDVRSQP